MRGTAIMLKFHCRICGGQITVKGTETTAECEYCGTKQVVPSKECEFINGSKEYNKTIAITEKKIVRKKLIVIGAIVIGIIAVAIVLFATHIICFHRYSDATVLEPQTCDYCDKTIGEPSPLTEIVFPEKGLAALLPTPKSNVGHIEQDSSTYVVIYIGEMSIDDFNEYVDECSNVGFDIDYQRGDSSSFGHEYYWADDAAGNYLTLSFYENLGILEIRVRTPRTK